MAVYNTEQRKILLNYMKEHSQTQYTVEELIGAMESDGTIDNVPGKSTVYRLITKLVDEGTVKRFVKGHSRQFLYQLAGEHCRFHFHLKCKVCGKLFHLDEDASEHILKTVSDCSGFHVDREETTLYGLCKDCR